MEAENCVICLKLIAFIELTEGRCPNCATELEYEEREQLVDTERNRKMDWT
jgi:hypothetical protein